MKKENTNQETDKSETKGGGVIILTMNNGAPTKSKGVFDIDIDDVTGNKIQPIVPKTDPVIPVVETEEEKAAKVAADQKLVKDAELAKQYGGEKLDDKGNVLDSTGKIVKTAEEIVAANQPQAVELDGVKYKLDDKGNALGEDGKVFKTKEELDVIEAEANEPPPVVEFIQRVGITPIDPQTKQPKVYADSIDGMIEAATDIAKLQSLEDQRNFFKVYPSAEKLVKHLQAGGTEDTFYKEVIVNDYSKTVIDDANVEQQKQLLRESYLKKGIATSKADILVQRSVDANALLAESKEALTEMQKNQKAVEKQKEDDAANAEASRIKANNDYWNGVNEIVTKQGVVKGAIIPEAEKVAFFEYMSKPVTPEGYSQAMLDEDAEDVETAIYLSFLRYKKYDYSKIVKEAINREKMKSLSTRFKRNGAIDSPEIKPVKRASNLDIDINMIN